MITLRFKVLDGLFPIPSVKLLDLKACLAQVNIVETMHIDRILVRGSSWVAEGMYAAVFAEPMLGGFCPKLIKRECVFPRDQLEPLGWNAMM